MIPVSGASLLFHLLVLLITGVRRLVVFIFSLGKRRVVGFTPRTPVPGRASVFATICVLFISSVLIGSVGSFGVYTNVQARQADAGVNGALFHRCKEIKPRWNRNNRVVVIRIDDVQAFAWNTVAQEMINESFKRNAPVTLGVIPKNLRDDVGMYQFLHQNNCNIDIALHGWDHGKDDSIAEFEEISHREAYLKILRGKAILEDISHDEVHIFIPPENKYSPETTKALLDAGFNIVSAGSGGAYDFTTTSYDFHANSLVSVETMLAECEAGFEKNGQCIVMLHPQDYATNGTLDPQKYVHFLLLLNGLEERGIVYSKLSDL